MTQDEAIILALKIVLISGFISLTAWVAVYTKLTRWAAWKNPVGKTLMVKSLLLAGALVPTTMSLFINFSRLTSHVAGWIDVVLLGAITPVMWWRIAVWLKIHRSARADPGDPPDGGGEGSSKEHGTWTPSA